MKQRINICLDMDVYLATKTTGINMSKMINEILRGVTNSNAASIDDKNFLLEEIEELRKQMNIIQQKIAEKIGLIANIDSQIKKQQKKNLEAAVLMKNMQESHNILEEVDE